VEAGLELRVHKVSQAASGGSHVTIYEAKLELVSGGCHVEVLGVQQNDAPPGAAEAATDAIRRGAKQVLRARGLGAIIRVERIVLHPVDFNPGKFERYTATELKRILEANHVEPGATIDRPRE
jgi:hypothetical protein